MNACKMRQYNAKIDKNMQNSVQIYTIMQNHAKTDKSTQNHA